MKECAICLEEVIGHQGTSVLKPCDHEFHTECIRRWHGLADNLSCPMCRSKSEQLVVRFANNSEGSVDLATGFAVSYIVNHQDAITATGSVEQLVQTFSTVLDLDENHARFLDEDTSCEYTSGNNEHSELSSAPEGNDAGTLVILQCGICGDNENLSLEYHCGSCQTLYHDACLRSLAIEVGDVGSWRLCVECQSELVPGIRQLIIRDNQVQKYEDGRVFYHADNTTIFEGQLREKNSVRTEQMYRDVETLRNSKREIQSHVRKCLNRYYHSQLIDRDQFTRINKQVSRELYRNSGYRYDKNIDYNNKAEAKIRRCITEIDRTK